MSVDRIQGARKSGKRNYRKEKKIKYSKIAHENSERRMNAWKRKGKGFCVGEKHAVCGDPSTAWLESGQGSA